MYVPSEQESWISVAMFVIGWLLRHFTKKKVKSLDLRTNDFASINELRKSFEKQKENEKGEKK